MVDCLAFENSGRLRGRFCGGREREKTDDRATMELMIIIIN